MDIKQVVRVDKWLWAVRLFKTRSLAAEACRKGKILANGQVVKPSHAIKVGEVIGVKHNPVLFSFEILAVADQRMSAKLVPQYLKNVTTVDQWELFELEKLNARLNRERGSGRPTKKERRDLDDFFDTEFQLE